MQTGSQGSITEINVTPLVDVCLVLVIIFMVIAPFVLQAGIEIATTRVGAAKGKVAMGENVRVLLNDKGGLRVNGRKVSWEELGQVLREAIAVSRDKLVSLDASRKAKVGQVVEILDTSKQNGALRLALVNQ